MKKLLLAAFLLVAACDCAPEKPELGHVTCYSYGQKVYESDTQGYVDIYKAWAQFRNAHGQSVVVTGNCTYVRTQ